MNTEADAELTVTVNVKLFRAMQHVQGTIAVDCVPNEAFVKAISGEMMQGAMLSITAIAEKLVRIAAGTDSSGRPMTNDEARQHTTSRIDS